VALSVLIFYHHAIVEVLFDLLQEIQVDNCTAVDADEDFRIEDLFQFTYTGRTHKLVVLRGQDGVVAGSLQVYNLFNGKVKQLLRLLNKNIAAEDGVACRLKFAQQSTHI